MDEKPKKFKTKSKNEMSHEEYWMAFRWRIMELYADGDEERKKLYLKYHPEVVEPEFRFQIEEGFIV
jgi:hypothetical protein